MAKLLSLPRPGRSRGRWLAAGVALLAVGTTLLASVSSAWASPTMQSTGSSFAAVAIQQWVGQTSTLYGLNINWQVQSSVVGLNDFAVNQVDFAASDIPYSSQQAQSTPSFPYQYLPDVAGGLAFMYNLNGNDGQQINSLNLNAQVIDQIFLGEITSWNNPAIAALNPSLAGDLPSTKIVPVYRTDASGENYLLSDYLLSEDGTNFKNAQIAFHAQGILGAGNPTATWPTPQPGVSISQSTYPGWAAGNPVGQSGSDNAANYVSSLSSQGSITYVETAYAKEHNFPVANLANASGHDVQPTSLNVATALEAAILHTDLTQNLANVYVNPIANAYPLSAYSYLVTPCTPSLATAQGASCAANMTAPSTFPPQKGLALGQFVGFLACAGQQQMATLGYSPLPPNLVQDDLDAIGRLNGGVEPPPVSAATCKNPYVDGQIPLPGEPAVAGQAGGGLNPGTTAAAGGARARREQREVPGRRGRPPSAHRPPALQAPAPPPPPRGARKVSVPPRSPRATVSSTATWSSHWPPVRTSFSGPTPSSRPRRESTGCPCPSCSGGRWPPWSSFWGCPSSSATGSAGAEARAPTHPNLASRVRSEDGETGTARTGADRGPGAGCGSAHDDRRRVARLASGGHGWGVSLLSERRCPRVHRQTAVRNRQLSDRRHLTDHRYERRAVCLHQGDQLPVGRHHASGHLLDITDGLPGPDRPVLPQRELGDQLLGSDPDTHLPGCGNANLSQVSIPVFFDAAGSGDDPLPSHDVLNANGAGKGFFCDNTNSPCAVEVTEELGTNIGNGPPDSTSNTLVFPINFRTQSTGCPKADPVLNTDSSFSLEHFMPPAVDASCKGAHGVVALNTATDNLSDISDLTHGGVQIAFVDDPGDPKIQSALAGKPYAYIPVAVSATVVSFLAGQEFSSFGSVSYPLSSYNLTPNMLAGLITSEYQTANGSPKQVGSQEVPGWSDNLIPPLKCAQLFQCPSNQGLQVYNEALFNTFDLLNTPPPHVVEPQQFGAFMSNVSTGSSYQATSWICKAPNAPFPVTVDEQTKPNGGYHNVRVSVTDQNIGSTTLTSAPVGTSIWPPYTSKSQPDGPKWVFPTCQGYSTIPSLASGDTDYGESQNPSFQAKSIRTFAYGGQVTPAAGTVPAAGFGVMDSSEAQFNGLNMANLQNADGQFVYPSAENIEAAAAAMTPCPAHQADCPPGTYQINYATAASPTSYPMPDITYAVVSTAPQKAAQVTETEDLLTSLVTYSNKASLPGGYAPLPADLYQAALTDITHDFLPKPGSSTKPAETGASAGGSPARVERGPTRRDIAGIRPDASLVDLGGPQVCCDGQAEVEDGSIVRTRGHDADGHHPARSQRGVEVPVTDHAGAGGRLSDRRTSPLLPPRVQTSAQSCRGGKVSGVSEVWEA